MTDADRTHDIVVWGATGVAGRFVAEYLTERYAPDDLSLAVGGRSPERLEQLVSDLTGRSDAWDDVPVVVGDATDPESLRAIARDTRVVCTTVGPYTTYGTPLVDACVEAGTDYCDLTGEINWVREIIDRYHEAAVDAEARIVHSCGFDSVPADLGTLLAQSFAVETFDAPCQTVRIYLEGGSGGVSGAPWRVSARCLRRPPPTHWPARRSGIRTRWRRPVSGAVSIPVSSDARGGTPCARRGRLPRRWHR